MTIVQLNLSKYILYASEHKGDEAQALTFVGKLHNATDTYIRLPTPR